MPENFHKVRLRGVTETLCIIFICYVNSTKLLVWTQPFGCYGECCYAKNHFRNCFKLTSARNWRESCLSSRNHRHRSTQIAAEIKLKSKFHYKVVPQLFILQMIYRQTIYFSSKVCLTKFISICTMIHKARENVLYKPHSSAQHS